MSKSEVFLAGGTEISRNQILQVLGFQEGKLPVRYLGVPIISSQLGKVDYNALVNLITARVQSWGQHFLSFAGRLQLIRSVLHYIQVFSASIFMLPRAILDHIDQIFRQFLWKGPGLSRGGVKVTWEEVCLSKKEGGLEICALRVCNTTIMLKHIWILFMDKESLWCKWIHSTYLKRKNFWIIPKPTI